VSNKSDVFIKVAMLMKKTSTKQFAIRIRGRTLFMIHAPLFYSNSLYDVDKTYALEQKEILFL